MGQSQSPKSANAVFNMNGVTGTISFSEGLGGVKVMVRLNGLPSGDHGLHVHQFGDISGDTCNQCGAHYNPRHERHGGVLQSPRHPGDLGNVRANVSGIATAKLHIPRVKLSSLVGRSVVIHAGEDDLGNGRGPARQESFKTGNSGARLACAVIGWSHHD